MNLPDDIIHNILSYVDLYEDKRSKVFHQIKMKKVLTEIKEDNEIIFSEDVVYYLLPHFEYIFQCYTDYRDDFEYTREEYLEMILNHIPKEIMYIKSYLENPYKKWITYSFGNYYSKNSFASHVEYMKKNEPNIVNELLELKSNYLYNFIDEYIKDIVNVIINDNI